MGERGRRRSAGRWFLIVLLLATVPMGGAVLLAATSTDQGSGAVARPAAETPPSTSSPVATATSTVARTTTTLALKPPVQEVKVVYYDVSGRTVEELRQALERNGLVDTVDRTRVDALTEWYISWTYGPGRFDPRSVQVTGTATITMPRWTPPPGASERVVARWSRFVDALQKHEDKHADTMRRCSSALPSRVESATSRADADGRADALLAECNQQDIDLDVSTDHGAKEGVIL